MSQLKVNSIVDAAGGSSAVLYGVASPPNSMGFRNRIINGEMRIDQRNAGASVALTSASKFITDRFAVRTGTGTGNTAIQSTTAPAGQINSLLITVGTGASSGASDNNFILQSIEGFNIADLGWGSASAQPVTLSFQIRSSLTGTFSGALRNSAGNRSYPFTYTISAANTFESKTVTIAGDTSGTWLTNNGEGIGVFFDLGTGSTYQGTAGAWAAADYRAASGAVKLVATSGATFYITGVQLEAGSVASPFERRDYGRELMMCQRYYISAPLQTSIFPSLSYVGVQFPVTMRASPTVSVTTGSGAVVGTVTSTTYGFHANATSGGVPTGIAYTATIEL